MKPVIATQNTRIPFEQLALPDIAPVLQDVVYHRKRRAKTVEVVAELDRRMAKIYAIERTAIEIRNSCSLEHLYLVDQDDASKFMLPSLGTIDQLIANLRDLTDQVANLVTYGPEFEEVMRRRDGVAIEWPAALMDTLMEHLKLAKDDMVSLIFTAKEMIQVSSAYERSDLQNLEDVVVLGLDEIMMENLYGEEWRNRQRGNTHHQQN